MQTRVSERRKRGIYAAASPSLHLSLHLRYYPPTPSPLPRPSSPAQQLLVRNLPRRYHPCEPRGVEAHGCQLAQGGCGATAGVADDEKPATGFVQAPGSLQRRGVRRLTAVQGRRREELCGFWLEVLDAGLRFTVWGLGFWIFGIGCMEFMACGLELGVQSSGLLNLRSNSLRPHI